MAVKWRGDISLDGSAFPHRSLLTGLRAAAGIWAARTADIAAATVRAALAPADPHQHEEEEDPQDHQADKHPLWKDVQRNLLEAAPSPHFRTRHAGMGVSLQKRSVGRTWGRKDI